MPKIVNISKQFAKVLFHWNLSKLKSLYNNVTQFSRLAFYNDLGLSKDIFTRVGLEKASSGLTCQGSTN